MRSPPVIPNIVLSDKRVLQTFVLRSAIAGRLAERVGD